MSHERRIDRLSPGLILFLVDQSESMSELLPGSPQSKAQAVADQLNRLVYELILRSVKTPREPPRAYFYIAVVGYSTGPEGEPLVGHCLTGPTSHPLGLHSTTDLAASPLRIDRVAGPVPGQTINAPVWLEPIARGGTPMCGAFNVAGSICAWWVTQYPDAFPPVVVNLTDGDATDGDPAIWARRLKSLASSDGNTLLFNINLSERPSTPLLFPWDPSELPGASAAMLYEMSSPLPESMLASALSLGLSVRPKSRGFAYNADLRTLAAFLNVGTSIGRAQR
ncbi:MAG: hypothetical protein WAQ75_00605 [Propionicimonas sp.]